MSSVRRPVWIGLAFAVGAVLLTILDQDHLGVLVGPLWRSLHNVAWSAGVFSLGWAYGAARPRSRPT